MVKAKTVVYFLFLLLHYILLLNGIESCLMGVALKQQCLELKVAWSGLTRDIGEKKKRKEREIN